MKIQTKLKRFLDNAASLVIGAWLAFVFALGLIVAVMAIIVQSIFGSFIKDKSEGKDEEG